MAIAKLVGSVQTGEAATVAFEACGSPSEVGNDVSVHAEFGHRYGMWITDALDGMDGLFHDYSQNEGKSIVWTNVVWKAPDQLRQRVAWALSQILVIGEAGLDSQSQLHEPWSNFYDIFTRHAFGNYRDVLREVSYSPMMGEYLTYRNNKAFAASTPNSAPDENYAREIMQLFSIGLYELNADGTVVKDTATYDNNDIVNFARAWTGFKVRPFRGNLESRDGEQSNNYVDPMQIDGSWRDVFPKRNLYGGFIGDSYPLCVDLPPQQFLKSGARYRFLGSDSFPVGFDDSPSWYVSDIAVVPRLTLDKAASSLYAKLCAADSSGKCTFPAEVDIAGTLSCHADECNIDAPRVVQMIDLNGKALWYEYVRPPCVELTFFEGGRSMIEKDEKTLMCGDPRQTAASVTCCGKDKNGKEETINADMRCKFIFERTTFKTAVARCAAESQALCSTVTSHGWFQMAGPGSATPNIYTSCGNNDMQVWLSGPCTVKVQVDDTGMVNLVHEPTNAETSRFKQDGGNKFAVSWEGGNYPTASAGCGGALSGCTKIATQGGTCVCDTTVVESTVFGTTTSIPTREAVEAGLHIGSPDPATYGVGEYSECQSGLCKNAAARPSGEAVRIFAPKGWTDPATMGPEHIFLITARRTGRSTYLRNKASTVRIGDSSTYSFRNPSHFMSFTEPTQRDAEHETEAVLDHFFFHSNTAPFVVVRLIQRLVLSNPSPRYVRAAVDAFRTGTYDGKTYSGTYGDLGATIAAILLDREARSPVLDADPTHGKLREPLLKVIHVLRSMEFQSKKGQEINIANARQKIGQRKAQRKTPAPDFCD